MKKYFILTGLILTALFSLVRGQQIMDGIAAIVGDDIVLVSDINGLVVQYAFQNKIDLSRKPDLYESLRKQFLESL